MPTLWVWVVRPRHIRTAVFVTDSNRMSVRYSRMIFRVSLDEQSVYPNRLLL